jgi:transposase
VPRATALEVAAQKKSLAASERDTPRVKGARAEYQERILHWVMARLKFIDEAGINLAMTRLYGRAAPGARVRESVPQNYGENLTLLAALSIEGVSAPMTINGAVDGEVFRAYVEYVLAPSLKPGDSVVMDNLGAHKVAGIREAIEGRGAVVEYLPPYSPDLNPIEKCWSKIKTALRKAKARTREALEAALKEALHTITQSDARAWFTHCGYTVH